MTMLAFELAGVLDQCTLFDKDKFDISKIKYTYIGDADIMGEYKYMEAAAIEQGRHDIASAIRKCLRRSKLFPFMARFEKMPILWRIHARFMENTIY